MKFGPVAVADAEGAIAAHSIKLDRIRIKKGTRLSAEHIEALEAAGATEIVVAKLEPGDVHEDEAAGRVAALVAGHGIRVDRAFTGRANLFAEAAGVLEVGKDAIDTLNRIDPGLTLATLRNHVAVEAGRMVATVKVIPFALAGQVLDEAEPLLSRPVTQMHEFRPLKVGLVATRLPGLKASVMDKTRRVLESRLQPAGAELVGEIRVDHEADAVADAMRTLKGKGAELLILFGASAITDEGDVLPAAIERAGGRVIHFGMPVDPGNLLLLGEHDGAPVLGAPGCARSPVENGFDWVLNRLLAGLEVTPDDITGMGVGGLLMETVSRPQPRNPVSADGPVAAVVLAAGRSRRTGERHKLLAKFQGEPMVRRAVKAVLSSKARPVIVVTGHRGGEIREALAGLDLVFVDNPDFAEGLSSSLRAGLAAVPDAASGALVVLADMPGATGAALDRIIAAFDPAGGKTVVLPTAGGKRGNPVLWGRQHFDALNRLTGDSGARHLIGAMEDAVATVELGAAAALDLDTPEALEAAGAVLAD